MILELFPCSGGMAEGFRRADLAPDIAFDIDDDACSSYETNHGHRPIRMDVRDLLRMVRAGWQPAAFAGDLHLIVADPPCTPWSRAGKRKGVGDARDMLLPTIELIRLLRPRCYLIGNVPGLDDAPNWRTLQRALAPLADAGYCIRDFAALDAADFGVPQHRVRPFWFGHLVGPCIRWPSATHGDPNKIAGAGEVLFGERLKPWVTCREALGHLPPEQLGRPVRMKRQDPKHPPVQPDKPSTTVRSGGNGNAAPFVVLEMTPTTTAAPPAARRTPRTPQSARQQTLDEPARTVRGGRSWGAGQFDLVGNERHPISRIDEPAISVRAGRANTGAQGGRALEWPWPRPSTTIQRDARIPPPGHHDEYSTRSMPNAIVLSELAAAILQGFPPGWVFAGETKTSRWSQIGQAMPPGLAEAVARAVKAQMESS